MPETSIDTIKSNLDADLRWRERRHPQWTQNYQLYRDTVVTNRLTQRQSVNVPLMKETIRTLLSRSGEAADLAFEDYANDGQRELLNAYVEKVLEDNRYELLDVVDKKNVGLYGRSYTKLNILDGEVKLTIHDPFDIVVDRYALPWNIDTVRRVTHVGIYHGHGLDGSLPQPPVRLPLRRRPIRQPARGRGRCALARLQILSGVVGRV